jgi:hypothetical protein
VPSLSLGSLHFRLGILDAKPSQRPDMRLLFQSNPLLFS